MTVDESSRRSKQESVTVVVRTRNSAATIGRCLDSIAKSVTPVEVVIVDGCSTDGTLGIALRAVPSARIYSLEPESYTPGRAINMGFAEASTEFFALLSSHCTLPDALYYSRAIELMRGTGASAVNGAVADERGRPLRDFQLRGIWPSGNLAWGFSNHSSVFTREAWEANVFDAQVDACEDKIFALGVHQLGGNIAYSPSLVVTAAHRRNSGIRANYRRVLREYTTISQAIEVKSPIAGAAQFWVNAYQGYGALEKLKYLMRLARPVRLLEAVAIFVGLRRGKGVAR